MNKEEEILREKVIRDYLEEQTIEILENIEEIQKKQDKLIAKMFKLVKNLKQMTLQEFLRIKSKKVKKAILDAFFRDYDQYEVV
ncbi:unnamed protein product [marine sediment metagenome]|uniref:Uncharacterized protein n=1 Tax=marine sediment metagenome TaxID=412755 RepID=X1IZE3_9ZZZZ